MSVDQTERTTKDREEQARRGPKRSDLDRTATAKGVTLGRVLRSEWLKLWTLPSTYWVIAITLVVMIGVSALMALAMTFDPAAAGGDPNQGPPPQDDAGVAVVAITFGYYFGQIVVAVLGVLIASSEYATGQIRSTLSAVPTRLPVLVAKIILTTVVSFTLGAVALGLSWLVTYPILNSEGITLDLGADGVWEALLGVPLYLTAIALFGLALGFLLRHTAGGISTILGILLVLPFAGMVQLDVVQTIVEFFPGNAGALLIGGFESEHLTGWQGMAVLWAYPVISLIAAGILLRNRDA